jgi:hypothetical protein
LLSQKVIQGEILGTKQIVLQKEHREQEYQREQREQREIDLFSSLFLQ